MNRRRPWSLLDKDRSSTKNSDLVESWVEIKDDMEYVCTLFFSIVPVLFKK